ncbi:hypothetical protein [Faecalicatena orotica]|uniref:hypothetical protein n=1 Tax=Faecalicatena orotica TaxID=1544 RepID=UPI003216A57C
MFHGDFKKRNTLFLLAVLVLISVYYFFYSQPGASMQFSENDLSVTFSGGESDSATFLLKNVQEISFVEEPDYGKCLDGSTSNGGNMYGLWCSDRLGTYQAYASSRAGSCILIKDAEKTAVFNYENTDTTYSAYEELRKYWKRAGAI